jgi:hypothetical protein
MMMMMVIIIIIIIIVIIIIRGIDLSILTDIRYWTNRLRIS